METKGIITVAVTVTVAVIVLAGIMMPVLTDATTTEDTYLNDGYFRMSSITSDDETDYTISWDVATPNTIVVNDVPVAMNFAGAPSQVTVVFDNDWMFRANISNGAITNISYITNAGGSTVANSTIDIVLSGGSMSVTMDTTSKTEDYTVAYIPDTKGEYVMKKSDSTAYVFADSNLIAFGMSKVNTSGIQSERGVTFIGDIADGVTPYIWRPPTDTTSTITDVAINATENSNHIGLYDLTNVTMVFHYVNNDESVTDTTLTYSYFLVPSEVTAERTTHLTDSQNVLLAVIPIFILVAVLLGVVAVVLRSRMD